MYQPIEHYGLIGDMHTAALVGRNGSLDWLCLPYFDSPSVFARVLDEGKGGFFQVQPEGEFVSKQVYWADTNVLVTRFFTDSGVAELIDFMPVANGEQPHYSQVVRLVRGVKGTVSMKMSCQPALNYARDPHSVRGEGKSFVFEHEETSLWLESTVELVGDDQAAKAIWQTSRGDEQVFTFGLHEPQNAHRMVCTRETGQQAFDHTVHYWRNWLKKCTYQGRWREMVYRSALTLKLLTFQPTGAIVAAPTCSLPEEIGGKRNWDYRYTWIRDAAFTVYAFLRIGFTDEAAAFMQWVEARISDLNPDGSLQIMYGIDGRKDLKETLLGHLDGYRDSSPVRIGNGAYRQLQLDIYGELMDAVYLYNKYGAPISYSFWSNLRQLTNWVCDNWQEEDEGIWEVRGGQRHFVYSKVMCWVCIDRALRLAEKRSFPADRDRWLTVRDEIYEDIMAHGWSEKRQAFVQAYGSNTLDAANLTMPLVLFMAANDPRMIGTLDATLLPIEEGGLMSGDLIYRYDVKESDDGISGEEGTFNICTFWLVEAMTRAGRVNSEYLKKGRMIFEHMLSYANHLGLFAEETGPKGEALGNYPQAFTHLALISAAYNLDRTLGEQ